MADTDSLTHQRLLKLLHYDPLTGVFVWLVDRGGWARAGTLAGSQNDEGYVLISIDGVTYRAHRLAWFYAHKAWPAADIDHRDTVRHHNWLSNLRPADDAQNGQNRTKPYSNNKSGFLGVSWDRKKGAWLACIMVDRKQHRLGHFDDPADGHSAYLAAKANLHPFWYRPTANQQHALQ